MRTQTTLDRWDRYAEWPLAVAAFVFLAAFSVQVLVRPHGHAAHDLWALDWGIWAAFMADYVVRLYLAPDRWHWFWRHLLDLAIVTLPLVRPLRLLRLLVIVELVQRAVGDAFRGRIVVYTVSGVLLLIYTASLAVFDKERYLPGATINSFGKALWWSITTVTTVGYGDVYPVNQHRAGHRGFADDRRGQPGRRRHRGPRVVDHPAGGRRRERHAGRDRRSHRVVAPRDPGAGSAAGRRGSA